MSKTTPPSGKPLPQMEIPEDLEPLYVNVVRITHSPSEMVFDFARILPGMTLEVQEVRDKKIFALAIGEGLAKTDFSIIVE